MKILVWDLPTRLFHWLFAATILIAWSTGELDSPLIFHVTVGCLALVLFLFRMVWGFMGSRYARFSSFLYAPGDAIRYLLDAMKGRVSHYIGHNPAGSWAAYGLLALGLVSVVSGVATLLGGHAYKEIHEFSSNAMLILVVFHVAGVVFSSYVHHENLARAMVIGYKEGQPDEGIPSRHGVAGLVLVVLLVLTLGVIFGNYDGQKKVLTVPFTGQQVKMTHEHGGEHD
jgi:cytochrome b